eukprot:TRINITY_DN8465_c0_g1_i2.p1 TRINITY_DN8465_c0_g1~~TRINITY_DN8465_c0_g1_i2.p1  ORF type:complete len:613 (-),score=169.45 TRINITY_DN8465_c0_g1_i2:179-1828(-)
MQTSKNPFVVAMFPEKQDAGGQKKRPTTAGFKIKTSANELMTTLSQCNPHYVRCIKPNDNKRAGDWDEPRVEHQCRYLGLLENVRVRRAGFAYRAPFERFLRRYKKLSPSTWGIRGEFTGAPRQGCEMICQDLQLASDQWQMGKSKIFIRHPETLFHLEEQIERKEFNCACIIQKGFKQLKKAKQAVMISNLVRGKKERRRDSVGRRFTADYINYKDGQRELKAAVQAMSGKEDEILFADNVMKVNRRGKPEKRFFVVTQDAFYIVTVQVKKKETFYVVTRRTALADVTSISLSTLQDNLICLHVPKEYDNLIECDKKTEIAAVVLAQVELLTRNKPPLNFSDVIQYKIKNGSMSTLKFVKDEKLPAAKVSGGKCAVSTGLPRDTDTAPKLPEVKPFTGGGGSLGGGAPMGGGASRGGMAASRGAPSNGAPRGGMAASRGAPMGGGAPPRGGGAPMGGGRPKQMCKALYDFSAENGDELTFPAGATIELVSQDGEWWTGLYNGQQGLFPGSYVEMMAAAPASSAPARGGMGAPRGAPGGAPRGGGGMPR